MCEAASYDDCCAIEGCDWYSAHGGCFHGSEHCRSDADCPGDQHCDVRGYPSMGTECGRYGLTESTRIGFCVPR